MIEILEHLSFLISGISFSLVFILYAETIFLRFEPRTMLRALGFLLLSSSSFIYFLVSPLNIASFWISLFSFLLIFLSFTLEPHSKIEFLLPVPFILAFVVSGHLLLLVLAILIAISIFHLIYTTMHKDLLPLGIAFVLIAVGEYFYFLQTIDSLKILSPSGAILYLFASLVIIPWVWSYFAIRFMAVMQDKA